MYHGMTGKKIVKAANKVLLRRIVGRKSTGNGDILADIHKKLKAFENREVE